MNDYAIVIISIYITVSSHVPHILNRISQSSAPEMYSAMTFATDFSRSNRTQTEIREK